MDPHDSRRRRPQPAKTCRFAGAACAAGLLLLCAAAPPAARANLITNGGFETTISSGLEPASWTVTGAGIAIDSSFSYSGTNDAAFTATSSDLNPGTLSQTVATTPRAQYTLSFWLYDQTAAAFPVSESFIVTFGSFSKIYSGSELPGVYTQYSLSIPGADITSVATTLAFKGLQDPNSYTPVFNLDNVSLTAANPEQVPEPSSLALLATALGFGMLGLAGSAVRRR